MPALLRKIIVTFAAAVFLIFLALIIAAWVLGAFDSVQIAQGQNGPYYFISFDSTSTYRETPAQIESIKKLISISRTSPRS